MNLRISLLGRFSVRLDGQPVAGFDPQKVQELLSYLLLFRGRPHHREQLATTLWESCQDTAQSKKYLRKTLWQLQNGLSCLPEEAFPLIVDNEWIELVEGEGMTADIDLLATAFASTRRLSGRELDAGRVELLSRAIALYQGELLEGMYHDWCILERQRYHFIYLVLLDKMIDNCLARRLFDEGFEFGLRVLHHDPAREHTHRQMMWLRYLAGDRTGALRQYERCAEILMDELGVTPSKQTETLYRQIRDEEQPGTGRPAGPAEVSARDALAQELTEIHQSLDELRRDINEHLELLLVTASRMIEAKAIREIGQKPA